MQYSFHGKQHLLNYYVLNDWYIVKLTSPQPAESYSMKPGDLPYRIRSFCLDAKIDFQQ